MRRAGTLIATFLAASVLPSATHAAREVQQRIFPFDYVFEVQQIPPGTKQVSIRFPDGEESALQELGWVRHTDVLPAKKVVEDTYGNPVLVMEGPLPKNGKLLVEVKINVLRRAYPDPTATKRDRPLSAEERDRWLVHAAERTPPDVAQKAAALTQGLSTDLDKAKALYRWAQDLPPADPKQQRSSSTFVMLCRATGIPARAVLGFKLPDSRGHGLLAGYRTWAEFFVPETGWTPVDFEDQTFGTLSANRVQLSMGSGETTSAPTEGKPVYPFIYPWVELDGKPHTAVRASFSYTDRVAKK